MRDWLCAFAAPVCISALLVGSAISADRNPPQAPVPVECIGLLKAWSEKHPELRADIHRHFRDRKITWPEYEQIKARFDQLESP